MREIRIHGRGGQGNVAAAEILSVAAFTDGKYAQGFPAFGAERTGAPVQAFVRISDKPIRLRSQIYKPDIVLVQDPTLLSAVNVLQGLKPEGIVILNSTESVEKLDLNTEATVFLVPATDIALEVIGRPTPNTTMLGAFAAATGEVSIEALKSAVKHRFGGMVGESNAKAVQQAFDYVKAKGPVPAGAARGAAKSTASGAAAAPKVTIGWPGKPGTSVAYPTGTWRTFRPIFKQDKCTGCTLCSVLCPEGVVFALEKKKYDCDYTYCKGCGICAQECPVDDIDMVKEGAE